MPATKPQDARVTRSQVNRSGSEKSNERIVIDYRDYNTLILLTIFCMSELHIFGISELQNTIKEINKYFPLT